MYINPHSPLVPQRKHKLSSNELGQDEQLYLNKTLSQISDAHTQPYKVSNEERLSVEAAQRPLSAAGWTKVVRPKPESPVAEKQILAELNEVHSVV